MTATLRRLLVVASLVLAVVVVVSDTLPPAPLPATAPPDVFAAGRAWPHIQVIAREPHPVGSPANAAVRAYLLDQLADLGLETDTQPAGELVNVLGRVAGHTSQDAVLLTAHYDSTLQSPGAADDASGVAALLETARALAAGGPRRNTIIFLFTDYEEGGFFGAQAFIADHPWRRNVRLVIGLDAGGVRGPAVLSATSAANGWLIRQLARADRQVVGSSAITALADSRTDFGQAFRRAGYAGYAFDFYWDKRDSPEDNLAHLSLASVQHQGEHALSLAGYFGDLSPLADPGEPDRVYFTLPAGFLVHYTPAGALASALAVLVLFAAVLALGLKRQLLSWPGMAYGLAVMLVGLPLAALPSLLLDLVIGRRVPGVTADWDNRLLDQPLPMSLLALTALSLVLLWYALAGRLRQTSLPDFALGALWPIAAGMAATALFLPGLSYGFTWPLLLSLMATAVWFAGPGRRRPELTALAGLLLAACGGIILVGPAILLGLFDQLTLALVFLGLLCGLLAPQLHLLLGAPLAVPASRRETRE